jgi:hypothetical protein
MTQAMFTGTIQRFEVYHFWVEQMRPAAKNKFVVVVHANAEYALGFVVNSRLNDFILGQPVLLPCHAPLECGTHGFLDHDSFVDCQTPYTFPPTVFNRETWRGILSDDARAALLEAVRDCPVLKPVYRKLILTG